MITILAEPLPPETASADRFFSLLIEPLLVVAAGLFWAIILPLAGIFCAGVAFYNRFSRFAGSRLCLSHLGRPARSNPLVLRRACTVSPKAPERSHARQAARA
jgi:hypothetical protein